MPREYAGAKLVKKTRRHKSTDEITQSKYWYLRYKDPRSRKPRYVCTGTSDTEKAEAFREEKMRELRAGQVGISLPAHRVQTLQVLDDYARHKAGKPSAVRLSYSLVHLINFWLTTSIAEINDETIQIYCDQKERAKGTLKRELNDLRAAVKHAVSMKRLEEFKFPKIPIKNVSRKKFLRRHEVAKLLWHARGNFRSRFQLTLYIVIAYYSGARKAAIMDLKWEQIDFDRNTIDFRDPDLDESNKRRPHIPMPPKLREFLIRRFRRYSNQSSYIFHCKTKIDKRVKSIDNGFRAAAARAELEDVTPHTLRHTRVSELVQEGYSIRSIMAYMALTYQTILSVYSHVDDKDVQDMAANIGRSPNVHKTK